MTAFHREKSLLAMSDRNRNREVAFSTMQLIDIVEEMKTTHPDQEACATAIKSLMEMPMKMTFTVKTIENLVWGHLKGPMI